MLANCTIFSVFTSNLLNNHLIIARTIFSDYAVIAKLAKISTRSPCR